MTYQQPQFSDPDDLAGTPDTRHASTLGKVRRAARAVPREPVLTTRYTTDTSGFDSAIYRVDGFFDETRERKTPLPINKPVYRPSGAVWTYLALVIIAVAVAYFGVRAGDVPQHKPVTSAAVR